MPEAASETTKPNRRRGVIFTTVFALVLGSIIYYLWTNHAYLKWRFVGGEVDLMDDCLATGYLSPGQVVTLINSGASRDIRDTALRLVGNSRKFDIPYNDRIVKAIRSFAAELPGEGYERGASAHTVALAIGRSGRSDLVDALGPLAGDENSDVRASVPAAFSIGLDYGGTEFGDEGWELIRKLVVDPVPRVRMQTLFSLTGEDAPAWATAAVLTLLSDPDAQVRRFAVNVGARLLQRGKGAELLPTRIRQILDSPNEDELLRTTALSALCRLKLIDDDELASLADDPQQGVAVRAKELIKERDEKREKARKKSSADE
jgi:hypothetical protein